MLLPTVSLFYLNSSQSLDHVRAIVVQVPELAVVTLMRPPERVLLQHLVRLELGPHPPPLVIGQGVSILLEQGVDPRDTSVPRIFEVFEGQATILCRGFLTFERVLGPHALRVDEF